MENSIKIGDIAMNPAELELFLYRHTESEN